MNSGLGGSVGVNVYISIDPMTLFPGFREHEKINTRISRKYQYNQSKNLRIYIVLNREKIKIIFDIINIGLQNQYQ